MSKPNTLLCTVGVSLFYPNLSGLIKGSQDNQAHVALADAYSEKNWQEVATQLRKIGPTERMCGAEINSVTDLLRQGFIEKGLLHLIHSHTDDGTAIATILQSYFTADDWQVEVHCVEGLRDDDPKSFRTQGLRNLAKIFGARVNESGVDFCAINATGGYKAQIAIAVLMGQALNIPVYYKHERFNFIISFPPMPVSLDFSLWQSASGMFMALSKDNACEPWKRFEDDWNERFEPLVNREKIDGVDYLELSATGQIFHETFRIRFRQSKEKKETSLPRPATEEEKESPKLGKHAYNRARHPIREFFQKLTDERPYVRFCHTTYWNPDLSETTRFRLSSEKGVEIVQGVYSNGSWCVKFKVLTTATDEDSLPDVVTDVNDWLSGT